MKGYKGMTKEMTREEAIEFGNMWLQINEDCKDSKENHKVGGTWGLRKALEIIDKYKAESEE